MEPILTTRNLSKEFVGHRAVDEVTVQIPSEKLTSIIGPNGAGKTTFFNLLSGQLQPSEGTIHFRGKDITRLSPIHRTRLGLGRSFQLTEIFSNLTVFEHVRLSVQSRAGIRRQMFFSYRHYREILEKTNLWLQKVQLESKKDSLAIHLSHGEKRKLEIAMLLALESDCLLLDEPTAGMALEEVPMILELIQQLKEEKRTVLLIEHKMDMLLDLSDWVLVLVQGRLLAQGTVTDMLNNEQVQAVYLGGGVTIATNH